MSIGQSAVKLGGWEVKAGMAHYRLKKPILELLTGQTTVFTLSVITPSKVNGFG